MKVFKPLVIPILCLVLIDQIIKIIISSVFMQYRFDIVDNFARFNPTINTDLSWAGNYIHIFSNLPVTVLLSLFVLFLFISGYLLYISKRKTSSFSAKVIIGFGVAGCLCSLSDKIFWGSSLDFIQITSFIFDLKDCYLTVAVVLFAVIGLSHSKDISVKEYVRFCYNKFKL